MTKTEIAVKKLPVIECFGPTIQGEGALCGAVSYFVRFGGCTYRCSWCDTMYAVEPAEVKKNAVRLTPDEIIEQVKQLGIPPKQGSWITLSGGDPLMHDLEQLIMRLHICGWRVAVETQGAFYKPWLQQCDHVTVSPKGPSSGESAKTDMRILKDYALLIRTARLCFKIPVFTEGDLEFAKSIHQQIPYVRMYLTAGTPPPTDGELPLALLRALRASLERLAEAVLRDPELQDVTVLPQMHTWIFGRKRGV